MMGSIVFTSLTSHALCNRLSNCGNRIPVIYFRYIDIHKASYAPIALIRTYVIRGNLDSINGDTKFIFCLLINIIIDSMLVIGFQYFIWCVSYKLMVPTTLHHPSNM